MTRDDQNYLIACSMMPVAMAWNERVQREVLSVPEGPERIEAAWALARDVLAPFVGVEPMVNLEGFLFAELPCGGRWQVLPGGTAIELLGTVPLKELLFGGEFDR